VHTATAGRSFVSRELLRDRNFLTATVVGSIIGLIFSATLALIPTMLQDLQHYPAVTIGIAMAPRGIGSLFAIIVVGRLVGRIDARILLAVGLVLLCVAQVQMSGFSLQMDMMPVIWSSVVQGLGIGFSFVPLSTLAFATLSPHLRTEGAAIYTLARTLGGSIGISVTQSQLTQNMQRVHATMIEHLRPDNPLAQAPFLAAPYSLSTPTGLATLNTEVTRQATMVAYVNDYRNMLLLSLLLLAMVPLLRRRKAG
jgi:DHA2 family multidrug resistance protein